MTGWWGRIPVPEQHVVGLATGLVLDRVVRRRLPRAAVAAGAPLVVGGSSSPALLWPRVVGRTSTGRTGW